MKLSGQTPEAFKTSVYKTANKKTLQTGIFRGGLGCEGKSGSSISQATSTGEGFDMTSIGGIWASFAVGDNTLGLGGVWWGK